MTESGVRMTWSSERDHLLDGLDDAARVDAKHLEQLSARRAAGDATDGQTTHRHSPLRSDGRRDRLAQPT